MRRIIVSMNVTIDGFMAGPDGGLDWQFNNWTTDMAEVMGAHLSKADIILLGRNTYSAMADYWPAVSGCLIAARDDMAFAGMMNNYIKLVCSTTLKNLNWSNSQLIKGNIRNEILKLKQQQGKDIMIYGSGQLVTYLMQYNLIDEYLLWVYPLSLGRGIPLFANRQRMKLIDIRQFTSGVVIMHYKTCQ